MRLHAANRLILLALAALTSVTGLSTAAQPTPGAAGTARPVDGPRGRPGGGPPFSPGSITPLLQTFDTNKDRRLDSTERKAARAHLAAEVAAGRGPRRPGPPGGPGGPGGPGRRGGPGAATEPAPTQPGPLIHPKDVSLHPDATAFDESVVRTIFLEFEAKDWETELAEFYHTDVDVPAKVTIDGHAYSEVGIHFRGASSFFTLGPGHKRSLNLSFDHARKDQRWKGIKTLNLLNAHTDPTYLRSMLYYHVAREYLPASRANLVRLVINGESWGIYVSVEQVNADFLKDRFQSSQGHRWKVPGSPRGRGSLTYLGDDPAEYRRIYSLKSKENPKAWTDLIRLCKTLSETPADRLEAELSPLLDIDGALRFLALENVFINNDGYWIRTSDFNLFQSPDGRFRLLPHDANETFRGVEGFGFGGGGGDTPRPRGAELSVLTGADDPGKPLLSKLLAVPKLRRRYLEHVQHMTENWLDWNRLAPLVTPWHERIDADVRTDVHKLYSYDAFRKGLAGSSDAGGNEGPTRTFSLKSFADARRAFLRQELTGLGIATP